VDASVQTTERYLGCKWVERFHCGGFIIVFLRPPLRSELKKVVHWMSETSGQRVECRRGGPDHDQPVCDARQLSLPEPEPIWSSSEKVIARTAFDAALGPELHEVIQEAKRMASQIQQSSDLWDLQHYLTQRRKEIDRN